LHIETHMPGLPPQTSYIGPRHAAALSNWIAQWVAQRKHRQSAPSKSRVRSFSTNNRSSCGELLHSSYPGKYSVSRFANPIGNHSRRRRRRLGKHNKMQNALGHGIHHYFGIGINCSADWRASKACTNFNSWSGRKQRRSYSRARTL